MASTRRKEFVAPIQVVVTAEVRKQIETTAKRENISMAQLIRELMLGGESLDDRESRSLRDHPRKRTRRAG
jgi:hypothetical protein